MRLLYVSPTFMPRADKLPQLAKLYGCTIEELLADDVDEVEDQ